MSEREEKFERMLKDVKEKYASINEKMAVLKSEDKTKSATYRQLLGDKLVYKNLLSLYKIYGLIEEDI